MKKEVKIAISIFLAIWIFVMGIEIGAYKEKKKQPANVPVVSVTESTTQTTTQSTTQPTTESTTQPTTESTTAVQGGDTTTTQPTSANTGNDISSLSKDQIVAEVVKYVNQAKAEQNMSATKDENINVQIVDISVSFLKDTVNNIVSGLVGDGPTTTNYTFTNGQTADGKTPFGEIPPCGMAFELPVEGVADAKAEKQGDLTVYTVTLVEEHTTKDAPVPKYNEKTVGYLDITSLDIPLEITTANMHYPATVVEVTVDANGKVTKLVNKLPMSGEGAISMGSASFEGGQNETWVFTY